MSAPEMPLQETLCEERLSPDGRFKLRIFLHVRDTRHWGKLRIEVWDVAQNRQMGETTRNYGNDQILHFVQQDGVDYLVLSEDYHGGYGVMNLQTGEKAVYAPPKDPANPHEQFWCWAAPVSHDPAARQLRIEGCYWACPYEVATFDFSRPMAPPYPLLSMEYAPGEEEEDDSEG